MLEKLRAKPDHIKKSISLIFTLVIFSGILFVWLSSWNARSSGEETREKTLSPLAGFGTIFEDIVSDVKNSISGAPSFVENRRVTGTSTVTSAGVSDFDMSEVVVIDKKTSSSTPVQ